LVSSCCRTSRNYASCEPRSTRAFASLDAGEGEPLDSKVVNDEASKVAVLLKFMEMQWQDHFQTRNQTWKTLQMDAVLAVGLVGIDWRLQSMYATTVVAILLIVSAFFGALITRRHRGVEIQKLGSIEKVEEILSLNDYDLLKDFKVPEHNTWLDVININKSNTALFILRTHIIFIMFGITYLIFRLLSGSDVG